MTTKASDFNGGHMAITDYDGEGINAGTYEVHRAYNFFGYAGLI